MLFQSPRVLLSSNGAYWQALYPDVMGKRRAKSLGPKSKLSRRQARILCDRLAAELQLSPSKASALPAPRLSEYLEQYLKGRTDIKPRSLYLLELTCRYIRQFFGDEIRIDRITRAMASAWRAALARGELKAARQNHQYELMNEVTVCARVTDARTIFNQAVRDDLIPFNPFDRLKRRAPEPDKDWYYVKPGELEQLLAACPDMHWQLLIGLCRLAGLRRGEAMTLTWQSVDWESRRLKVLASKTGRRRIVPVEPQLYALLLKGFGNAKEGQVRVANVNEHCLWRNFCVIRQKAGLPAWEDAFQVMRRNCETDWAQRFPQYAVSVWIGHDITVSATNYLQVTEDLYSRAAAIPPKS